VQVVFSTAPLKSAQTLASKLVLARVAACVNIVPQVLSVYRWKGAIETAAEALLVIKTADERVPELLEMLSRIHPYDVPEIIALEVSNASAPYAAWVDCETAAMNPD